MKLALAVLLGFFGWWQRVPQEAARPGEEQNSIQAGEDTEERMDSGSGLTFRGAESFPVTRLERVLERLQVRIAAPLELTEVDDAAFFIEQFYREQGFAEAVVTYEYDARAGRGDLQIDEGAVTYLGRLSFVGGEALTADRLQDVVRQSLRISSRSITARLRFVEEALWQAAEDLRTVYQRQGYLDVQIDFSTSGGAQPKTRDVEFFIDEGPQFVVAGVAFRGLPDGEWGALTKELIGTPWTLDEDVLLVGRVTRQLHNLGYHRAEVSILPELNGVTGEVQVLVQIEPGPLYRFGQVEITGPKRTFEAAIKNRLGLRPGKTYDRSELLAGERRLWFSGAFSEVSTEVVEREGQVLDVAVEVTEGKARNLRGTAGYSQWEQFFVNLGYTDRNFLGTLRELNIEGKYSALEYGGYLQLVDPMVFNSETRASVLGFFLREEMPGYQASFLGAGIGLARQFEPPNQTGYELQYVWRTVFDIEVFGEGSATAGDELSYTVGLVGWEQTLDRRNNPLAPMQGYLLNYQLGLATEAFGGTLNFFQPEAQATYYLPLRQITPENQFVPFLVFNHRVGWIGPFGGTKDIPIPERFFMGGPNSVRSFQLDGMGPRDAEGDPLGGELFWLLSSELQVPIFGPFYGVAFVDAGNLALTPEEYDWEQTRVALGLGARLYTPIGAVRLDYGYNLIRRDGDPIGAVQFGFGFTF